MSFKGNFDKYWILHIKLYHLICCKCLMVTKLNKTLLYAIFTNLKNVMGKFKQFLSVLAIFLYKKELMCSYV